MNKKEHTFQKWLSIWQLLGTGIVALGAVILAYGFSLSVFSSELIIDSIQATNETKSNLELVSNAASEASLKYIYTGISLVLGALVVMSLMIANEKVNRKKKKSSKITILFDEMYDGKDIELQKLGYDAHSVKKIRLTGEPLQYDYSVLKYVEENKMILITEDPENFGGCNENGLPCIKLGQNPSIDEITKELESLKKSDS